MNGEASICKGLKNEIIRFPASPFINPLNRSTWWLVFVRATHSAKLVAVTIGWRTECSACEFLALASRLITVRLVGFIPERGTPSSGRFLPRPPPGVQKDNYTKMKSVILLLPSNTKHCICLLEVGRTFFLSVQQVRLAVDSRPYLC